MTYDGRRIGPDDLMKHCLCGYNRGAHRPMEAYYGEEKLEGRKSTTTAQRDNGCPGYRESGLTVREVLRLRYCSRRWYGVRKGLEA
jgi:hypothetical protein